MPPGNLLNPGRGQSFSDRQRCKPMKKSCKKFHWWKILRWKTAYPTFLTNLCINAPFQSTLQPFKFAPDFIWVCRTVNISMSPGFPNHMVFYCDQLPTKNLGKFQMKCESECHRMTGRRSQPTKTQKISPSAGDPRVDLHSNPKKEMKTIACCNLPLFGGCLMSW